MSCVSTATCRLPTRLLLSQKLPSEVTLILKDREAYSRAPGEGLTLSDEIEGVCRAVEETGLPSVHLVGCSAGAVVAVAFSASYPERVESLALIEPPWIGNDTRSAEAKALYEALDHVLTEAPSTNVPRSFATPSCGWENPPHHSHLAPCLRGRAHGRRRKRYSGTRFARRRWRKRT